MSGINDLLEQAAKIEADIKFLRTWEKNVVALEDITTEQKIEAFDELYSTIHDLVRQAVTDGYVDKDMDRWVYEQVVDVTLGNGVWEVINRLH